MDELYYTPEISEFHVGFRYEEWDNYHDMNPSQPDEYVWHKYILPVHGYFEQPPCPFRNKMDRLRVKYLDEQDIIELGWIRNEQDDRHVHIAFTKGEHLNLYWCSEDHEVVINEDLHGGFMNNVTTIFMGKIKNFNEMQRLMKQLGIES